MLNSEKLAIAAHLHVLLRRKSGRVTDTEWMASNAEYATEIVCFARAKAQEDGHADLAEWAGKLEAAMATPSAKRPSLAKRPSPEPAPRPALVAKITPLGLSSAEVNPLRYISSLR